MLDKIKKEVYLEHKNSIKAIDGYLGNSLGSLLPISKDFRKRQ